MADGTADEAFMGMVSRTLNGTANGTFKGAFNRMADGVCDGTVHMHGEVVNPTYAWCVHNCKSHNSPGCT